MTNTFSKTIAFFFCLILASGLLFSCKKSKPSAPIATDYLNLTVNGVASSFKNTDVNDSITAMDFGSYGFIGVTAERNIIGEDYFSFPFDTTGIKAGSKQRLVSFVSYTDTKGDDHLLVSDSTKINITEYDRNTKYVSGDFSNTFKDGDKKSYTLSVSFRSKIKSYSGK